MAESSEFKSVEFTVGALAFGAAALVQMQTEDAQHEAPSSGEWDLCFVNSFAAFVFFCFICPSAKHGKGIKSFNQGLLYLLRCFALNAAN